MWRGRGGRAARGGSALGEASRPILSIPAGMKYRSDSAFDLWHVECVGQFSPSTEGLVKRDLGEDVSDSMVDLFLRQHPWSAAHFSALSWRA